MQLREQIWALPGHPLSQTVVEDILRFSRTYWYVSAGLFFVNVGLAPFAGGWWAALNLAIALSTAFVWRDSHLDWKAAAAWIAARGIHGTHV